MTLYEEINLLKVHSNSGKPFELRVSGISMYPVLHNGDIITVCRRDSYSAGDIIVFIYKDNILVHRLLKIENDRYFCKGDNAFRLEDVTADQIIGAVQLSSDRNNTADFISSSLQISKLFRKCQYDVDAVKHTPEYIEYAKTYLGE